MRSWLIILFCITHAGCLFEQPSNELEREQKRVDRQANLFSIYQKDSAFLIRYGFEKKIRSEGVIEFEYSQDTARLFSYICDTLNNTFIFNDNLNGVSSLYVEAIRRYDINAKSYKIFKLISDKGVIDGEVSHFISIDFGLMVNKSNTWRFGKIVNPETENLGGLELSIILFRILTDDNFYQNENVEINYKYTPPKLE